MQSIPLIRRKLVPARIPDPYVHRQTLHAQLQLGMEPSRRLTLVCGGPGYGKSTLAAAYLRELELPTCWVALEDGDADPHTFLTYVHAALAKAVPAVGARALELMRTAPVFDAVLQTVVGMLAEDLAEHAEDGGVVVLDDYQTVCKVPGILRATEFLIQYLPDNWQLLLISREMPPLTLPQLRVRQQLVEVGVKELRFSAAELRDLLQRLAGVTLSDAEALELLGHTDGWVASVILAAQAVKGAGGATRDLLLRELDQPAALYDYLAQEVFACQPEEVQAFLLRSSLLAQVDQASCRDALGVADAADRLRHLVQGNILFPAGDSFAYHPSFRRFLQVRLEETVSAADLQALYRQVGGGLAATAPEEALGLLLRGQAFEQAAELARDLAESMLADNQLERLQALLDRFPVDVRAASFPLCFYHGELLRLCGDFDQALGMLQRAHEVARHDGERGRALVHQAAIWMGRGDARVDALLAEGEPLLAPGDLAARAFAQNVRGAWSLGTNDSALAMTSYEAALACYRQLGDPLGQAKVLNNLGLCYTRFGQFAPALANYREAIAQSELAGRVPHPMVFNNMAAICCYQGEFAEAWAANERAMALAQQLKARRDALYANLGLGAAALGLADFRRAEEQFEAARNGATLIQDKASAAKAIGGLAEISLRQGFPDRARALLQQAVESTGWGLEDPRLGDLAILSGLVEVELGAFDGAEALLTRLAGEFAALGYRFREAQVRYYLARLATRRGDADAAARWAAGDALAAAHGYDYLKRREAADRAVMAEAVEAPAPVAPAPKRGTAKLVVTEPSRGLAPAIAVQCFGELRVWVGERAVQSRDWRGYKTKLILAYLLAHPDGVAKDQLTDLLYGEMDTTRTAILVLISRLRHALEIDLDKNTPSRFVHFVDGRYTFNFALPYQVDTQDFGYHLKQGANDELDLDARRRHWREALANYHGPYLAELTADGPWLTIERERYHRLAQEAHTALVRSYLDEGNDLAALEASEANLAFDSCCEFAHQVKMRCLARLGQREGAMRHYAIMKQVFERELGTPPSPSSEALYQSIGQGREVTLPEIIR